MLYKITPQISLNPEMFELLRTTEGTDQYSEPHTIAYLTGGASIEFSPAFTIAEIRAAINGGCYYRSEWTDECGDIDVCVVHEEVSDSEQTWDPLRFCRKRDPKFLIKPLRFDNEGKLEEEGWVDNSVAMPEPPEDTRPQEPTLGPIASFLARGGK